MRYLNILLITILLANCKENKIEMNVLITLEEVHNNVTESFNDEIETLTISDKLNDTMGINMAIITNEIIKKGYMPNGFDQKNGFRIYKYIKEE